MRGEDYEDYIFIEDLEDETLKQRLLKAGFKKIPLKSIVPCFIDVNIAVYRVDEKRLPEKMKKLILERISERNNMSVEEAEKVLGNNWFVRASGVGTRNVYKYIG